MFPVYDWADVEFRQAPDIGSGDNILLFLCQQGRIPSASVPGLAIGRYKFSAGLNTLSGRGQPARPSTTRSVAGKPAVGSPSRRATEDLTESLRRACPSIAAVLTASSINISTLASLLNFKPRASTLVSNLPWRSRARWMPSKDYGRFQPTGVPGLTFLSTVNREQPLSSTAASAIPFETIPIIFAGFKLATTSTCFPTSSSGL